MNRRERIEAHEFRFHVLSARVIASPKLSPDLEKVLKATMKAMDQAHAIGKRQGNGQAVLKRLQQWIGLKKWFVKDAILKATK